MEQVELTPFKNFLNNQTILASLDNLGFQEATQVQSLAIPVALTGKDLVVEAKTGSGKTLAFGIPMLAKLTENKNEPKSKFTFGLIVTPTRELAVQISAVFKQILPELDPVELIGGISYSKQQRQLQQDPRIAVGTPGRILDAIEQGDLKLDNLEVFALDEADEMFSIGFTEDVERILQCIPKKAQGLFVSATISPRVLALADRFLNEPEHISAAKHDEAPPQIQHLYCDVGEQVIDKPIALCDFLEYFQAESAIIFCNTKSETELVEEFMRRRGFDARRLNSDLNQTQRNRIMEKIRAKELRYLIATDIAARGIDIAQIELVVNFSIHQQTESYIHRTGRTGRAGKKGVALSLVGPQDFIAFNGVRNLGVPLERIVAPTDEEVANAQIIHLENSLKSTFNKLTQRDLVLAKSLINNLPTNDDPKISLEKFVAGLAKYTLEHLVKIEALSLEEELQSESPAKQNSQRRFTEQRNPRPKRRNF